MNAARKPNLVLGRRYRVNQQGNKADGRCGTLESVINGEAWLTVGASLVKAPATCLTDKGVVQADLTKYIIRPANQLDWAEAEKFA